MNATQPVPAALLPHLNAARKTVTFTLGAAKFPVRATLALMCEIEAQFGPATALFDRLQARQFRVSELRQVLPLLLAADKAAPQGEALDEGIQATGAVEIMNLLQILLAFGLSSDQPATGDKADAAAGN